METVDYLVVGAGVTGLAFANEIRERDGGSVLVLEADDEPGGYCKTIKQDGFVWDYSGHFFHFRRPEIEAWLRARMPGREVRTVEKRSSIIHRGGEIDFPFQKNIHQLPKPDFIDCLYQLYFRDEESLDPDLVPPGSFKEMVISRFGRGIAERFLIPYNEKLYATEMGTLDADAMGRFFPHADLDAIVRNMVAADNASYNATFSYPLGGAIEYIGALLHDLPKGTVSLAEPLLAVDVAKRCAKTSHREIGYRHLISSAPLPALAKMTGIEHNEAAFAWNQVLVYNLGFDRKGRDGVHWIYFPDRDVCFYRVGFYDNIMDSDRMSLYVEIGAPAGAAGRELASLETVLADLKSVGILSGHNLVSSHSVILDPAYVHITSAGNREAARVRSALRAENIHSAGRYGAWTYCSIEDNIVEARELAAELHG